jgi:hypothetical protein
MLIRRTEPFNMANLHRNAYNQATFPECFPDWDIPASHPPQRGSLTDFQYFKLDQGWLEYRKLLGFQIYMK